MITDLTEIIQLFTKKNPRSIIRYINNLIIDQALTQDEEVEIELFYFAISRGLAATSSWWYLTKQLYEDRETCEKLSQIEDFDNLDPEVKNLELPEDLLNNTILKRIFSDNKGKEWLKNHEKRIATIQFYQDQKE
jgi:uncharacterized protein Yka (UPF0111/DUF47 family)